MPSAVQAPERPPALELELKLELTELITAAVEVLFRKTDAETGATLVTLVRKPEGAEVLVLVATELEGWNPGTLKIETDGALDTEAAVYAPVSNPPATLDVAWLLTAAESAAEAGAEDSEALLLELALELALEPPLHCPSGQQLVPIMSWYFRFPGGFSTTSPGLG